MRLLSLRKLIYSKKELSAIVLGINDAVVELSASLWGLAFSLMDTKLVALAGFVVGISASFSMALSSYWSFKEREDNAFFYGTLTGVFYFLTTLFLITPFLLFDDVLVASFSTLIVSFLIIYLYSYFKKHILKFKTSNEFIIHFLSVVVVSLFSFAVGLFLKEWLGIDSL